MFIGFIGMLFLVFFGSEGFGLFEFVYGLVFDIVGQDKVNFMVMVLLVVMMLCIGLKQVVVVDDFEVVVDVVLVSGYCIGDLMVEGCIQLGCCVMGE